MSFEAYETTEAHEKRIARCRACNARIIFLPTDSGRRSPTDADSVEPGDTEFIWGKHVSHFSTCTEPNKFRKPR